MSFLQKNVIIETNVQNRNIDSVCLPHENLKKNMCGRKQDHFHNHVCDQRESNHKKCHHRIVIAMTKMQSIIIPIDIDRQCFCTFLYCYNTFSHEELKLIVVVLL